MVARVPLCDRKQLQLAIADQLSGTDSERLSDHLQGCAHCREELELLAGGESWWSEAKTFLSSSEELVAVEEVVGTLRVPSAHGTRSVPTTEDDEPLSLHFLTPSEQPKMLGRLGSYEIESVIGRGGMGLVLKAQDPALDRRVAIKVLAGHLATSAAARRRFAQEAKAAAAVVHDHVIPIHAVDIAGQTPYLVMPLVVGKSLQDRLDEQGPLETREVLRIAMQTAEGLAAAHAQGLVHRDIKPANILLENGCERVRITDFGLARAVDDASMTQSGYIAGTPQYMAPEQARGEPIDARADLFSLGSVMYAMCTGRPPFRAETTLAVLRRICDDPPRDVREVNPDVPPWLADIITRLLAKSPAERIQSASEVADLLKQWLAHLAQPTLILPPKFVAALPASLKPAKEARPAWLVALGIAGAVLAGGLIGVALSGYFNSGPGISTRGDAPSNQQSPSVAMVEPPSPSVVSLPSIDLPRESEFAAELAQAAEATYALEVESGNAIVPALSIADELADLESRTTWLETELVQVTKLPAPQPIVPEQPIPDAVPRLTEPSRSER